MNELDRSLVIKLLADLWFSRSIGMERFLNDTFFYSLCRPYDNRNLFIIEMKDGDAKNKNIGTMYLAKWVVDVNSTRAVPLDFGSKEIFVKDNSGEIYVSPCYLFCIGDDFSFLLSEHYGPNLIIRSYGALVFDSGTIKLSLQVDRKSRKFEIMKNRTGNHEE